MNDTTLPHTGPAPVIDAQPGTVTVLSPSKISTFTTCGTKFYLNYVLGLDHGATCATLRGTIAHAALEAFYARPPADRTVDHLDADWVAAHAAIVGEPDGEWAQLVADGVNPETLQAEVVDASRHLAARIFDLENPASVTASGLEQRIATTVGGVPVRGIIDRVDTDPVTGEVVIVDYKSGKAPPVAYERSRLEGVRMYAAMYLAAYGVRASRVRLIYLGGDATTIDVEITDQVLGATVKRLAAVWRAIQQAVDRGSFRPKVGPLCDWCDHKTSGACPAFPAATEVALNAGS